MKLRSHPRQNLGEKEELLYRNRLPTKQWKLDCHWISQWNNIFKAETGILYQSNQHLSGGKDISDTEKF